MNFRKRPENLPEDMTTEQPSEEMTTEQAPEELAKGKNYKLYAVVIIAVLFVIATAIPFFFSHTPSSDSKLGMTSSLSDKKPDFRPPSDLGKSSIPMAPSASSGSSVIPPDSKTAPQFKAPSMPSSMPAVPPTAPSAILPADKLDSKGAPGMQQKTLPPLPPREALLGLTFTSAVIDVMDYELNQRMFGWRPSSFFFGKLALTDNVNNTQMGVLTVVRRILIVFNDKIGRFSDSFEVNPHINNAFNNFNYSADKFWFTATTSMYNDAVNQLKTYRKDLEAGKAVFNNSSAAMVNILGGCLEVLGNAHSNLIKQTEDDGSPVSWFRQDDYFYYAKGVAVAMSKILGAAVIDFQDKLARAGTTDVVRGAAASLEKAAKLQPLIVMDGGLDSFFPNHRANLSSLYSDAFQKLSAARSNMGTYDRL
ncbi:MAG: DUF2333 family protein [Deltaproteobacteria bacterium]|nr:DUF2333 family protein [Deltaproteobacteria bacterium]